MNSKIAVLSDIHANYEALKAVLEDMDKNNINKAVSLGDNIGYGPDPNAVVATLKLHQISSVKGNHEMAVINPEIISWFNHSARLSLKITRSLLTENSLKTIFAYPDFIKKYSSLFVHGVPPDKILTYIFEISDRGIMKLFEKYSETFCFIGHTHQLNIINSDGKKIERIPIDDIKIKLKKNKRFIINSGSVGQPRGDDKKAKYLIFDRTERVLEPRFVDYDRQLTKKKILRLGFPPVYAEIL